MTLASVGSNPAIPASRKGTQMRPFSAGWDGHPCEPSRECGVGAHSPLGDRGARSPGVESANHEAKRSYRPTYLYQISTAHAGTHLRPFSAGWDGHLREPSRECGVGAHSPLGDRGARSPGVECANLRARARIPANLFISNIHRTRRDANASLFCWLGWTPVRTEPRMRRRCTFAAIIGRGWRPRQPVCAILDILFVGTDVPGGPRAILESPLRVRHKH